MGNGFCFKRNDLLSPMGVPDGVLVAVGLSVDSFVIVPLGVSLVLSSSISVEYCCEGLEYGNGCVTGFSSSPILSRLLETGEGISDLSSLRIRTDSVQQKKNKPYNCNNTMPIITFQETCTRN